MSLESCWSLLRLRIVAEADPGALALVLERFQNLNVLPRRVVAESGIAGELYIQVDVAGLPEGLVDLIVAKLGQVPCILNAYWHYT
jgi:hypothetical protein